ncbi:MAG: alanine--tRNA ligase [Oscillospiraceae bacterium]|nr:alanine--tRNA ligase [Oscillospiraceae bacterium]
MHSIGLNEIRRKYLKFFEGKGHFVAPSFPLVPQGDPSLLLVNSGMAPLKSYFSGEANPPAPRMATCQRCIRTPDIERVGKTSRHGTFFEMLGNFSFGDYFKRDAIAWAWEFCVQVMQLPPEKLFISVYLDDDEAWDIWVNEIGIAPEHMIRLGKSDNFWEIGSGPCGPCSEIYYDHGVSRGCGSSDCKPGCDCDRYVEFWNLVFTQYNNDGEGNYTPLTKKNIDTGMGLERLACIVQGVDNLFEVDTITRIRKRASEISGVEYNRDEKSDVSLRVITDHIRSTVMLICDGVLPSNEGRGYVLRRLLRRASRHGRLLGIESLFLEKLAETVIAESREAYPELGEREEYIRKVIAVEEERFASTIDAGMQLLTGELKKAKNGVFPGSIAFKLYDTFGFPVDLTLEILREHNLTLDRESFDSLLHAQRQRARDARAELNNTGWASVDLGLDNSIKTKFTGYDRLEDVSEILAVAADNTIVLLEQTPFYAESGGQVADTGFIEAPGGVFRVDAVKSTPDGKVLHLGELISGEISPGNEATAKVDRSRRRAIMRAHSTTHLLHKALREVLGEQVGQAGSLVEPDRIRFDFTHFSALTHQEISQINRKVNESILQGLEIVTELLPIEQAKAQGAVALFGEKYDSIVRVVKIGDYSSELCGGTHLSNTALAGSFFFTADSSVAAGVRRIEADVGQAFFERMEYFVHKLHQVAAVLKTTPAALRDRVKLLLSEQRSLTHENNAMRQKIANIKADAALLTAKKIAEFEFVAESLENTDINILRAMGDHIKNANPNVVSLIAANSEDKITFLAVCGKESVAKGVKAGVIVSLASKVCGGSGGGRPDSAMGGGKDKCKIPEAFAAVREMLEKSI